MDAGSEARDTQKLYVANRGGEGGGGQSVPTASRPMLADVFLGWRLVRVSGQQNGFARTR